MSENNAVLTRVEDNVLIISLNRPEIMNALDSDLVEGFIAALKRAGDDPEIGAVVLTAEGIRHAGKADARGNGSV